jgi:putative MATE family efflux protein
MSAAIEHPAQDACVVEHVGSTQEEAGWTHFFAPANLDDPKLTRLVLRLALPSVLGLSFNAMHHVTNAAFVGRIGTDAVAAISIALPIFLLVAALGHGLGAGAATLIGRLIGAKEIDTANAAATTSIGLALLLGLLSSVCLLIWLEPILRLFGATQAVLPLAGDYVGLLAFGCTLMLLQILCDFVVIAEGNSRFSMWTLIAGFGLNIVLDAIFIFGFGWGIKGAALATMTSQVAALAAFAFYFWKGMGHLRIAKRFFSPSSSILGPILSVGIPTTLTSAVSAFAFALLFRSASTYGADAAVAGIGIALRLFTFGELPIVGFCIGAQALLGYTFGAHTYRRLRSVVFIMLAMTLAFGILYTSLMVGFAGPVITLFTDDPSVATIGARAVIAFHALFLATAVQLVLLVYLQSLDKPLKAALVSLAPQGYFLVAFLWWMPRLWGLDGVLASPAAALGLTALLSIALLWHEAKDLQLRIRNTAGLESTDMASSEKGKGA